MKTMKKALACLLVVAMFLTAAPLSGFVGLKFPDLDLPEINFGDIFNTAADATDYVTPGNVTDGNVTDGDVREEIIASGTCGENLTWTLDVKGTLTISGEGDMENYSWDSPKAPWTNNITVIKKVIIEDGISSIGGYAFRDCDSLASITIPDSVTSIGWSAFEDCDSLASITIPDSVTSIGFYAFYDCDSLASITIPDSVTSIGARAFEYCTILASITIPDSVTSIGYYAFAYCTALNEIFILNPDCTIDDDQGTTIASSAVIRGYDNSTAQAYAEKYERTFVSLSGDGKDVILSGEAGDNAYFTITRDGHMEITGTGNMYDYSKPAPPWNEYAGFIKTVFVADGITSIGSHVFCGCSQVPLVTIPNSVTGIGDFAFEDCNSLASITIPDSVTSIGNYAFSRSSLSSVTIPVSVKKIGYCAFFDIYHFDEITILNPDCEIYDRADTIYSGATIYGYADSTAEEYAEKYDRTFVALDADTWMMGDIDHDGEITAGDARLALRASVGSETLTEQQKRVADVDQDGEITAGDARLILRASVGLENFAKSGQ